MVVERLGDASGELKKETEELATFMHLHIVTLFGFTYGEAPEGDDYVVVHTNTVWRVVIPSGDAALAPWVAIRIHVRGWRAISQLSSVGGVCPRAASSCAIASSRCCRRSTCW